MTDRAIEHGPPILLPRPRHVAERPGGRVDVPRLVTVAGVDGGVVSVALGERARPAPAAEAFVRVEMYPGAACAEAYRLSIGAEGVRIQTLGGAGAMHGLRTLRQLLRQYGARLPRLVIEDRPALAARGVMLDISRGRVPTMEQLFEVVEVLSSLKVNHLQLYTEHTFAYAGHEEIWRGASPMTPPEVRRLDAFCRERGVELAANQNCFGHLGAVLRLARYAPLAETHGEWFFESAGRRFARHGPFSLCPTDPRSLEFVRGLLEQLLPCFSGPLVNIGCDETFDVGRGRSREHVARRGRAAVCLEFVGRVAEIVRRAGRRPMFWADIALSHPGMLDEIPRDIVCLAWGYEPDAPFGESCGRLRGVERYVWVCPGTSSWRSIVGRTAERAANIARAAREGAAAGAGGLLATDWGDMGHRQQWPISLNALAHAADAAWTGGGPFDARSASLHAFGDRELGVCPWLDELGDCDLELRRVAGPREEGGPAGALRNASALFSDLHTSLSPQESDDLAARRGLEAIGPRQWEEVRDRIEDLSRRRPGGLSELVTGELDHTLRVARVAAERAVWRRCGAPRGEGARIAAELREIGAEHGRLWLARSRRGGLESSRAHYLALAAEVEARAGGARAAGAAR